MNAPTFTKHNVTDLSFADALAKVYPFAIVEAPIFASFGEGESKAITDQKAIIAVPNDNQTLDAAIALGVVGEGYHTVQFAEAAIQSIGHLTDKGLIKPVSGGFFAGVKGAWMQFEVPDSEVEISKNFPVKHYVNVFKGFVGNFPIKMKNGSICIVCQNTCYMARVREQSEFDMTARHTTNVIANIEQQSKALKNAIEQNAKMIGQFKLMAGKHIEVKQLEEYITDAITEGKHTRADFVSRDQEKMSTRTRNVVMNVLEKLDSPVSVKGDARGTLWHGFNAVTEYLSHDYGRDEGSRFEAIHLGAANRIGERAALKAMEMI